MNCPFNIKKINKKIFIMMIVCTVIFTTLIGGSVKEGWVKNISAIEVKEETKQVVKVNEMKEGGY